MFKLNSTDRRVIHKALHTFLLVVALFSCLTGISQGLGRHVSLARGLAAYTVSGAAFDDYNQNGTQDAREPGINGIVVNATNSVGTVVANATTSTISNVTGQYTLNIPDGTGPVRIQFGNFGPGSSHANLAILQPSNHAVPPVQFVNGTQATNTINFGLEYPSEYCQNNPNVATSCYVAGDQTNASSHVVVRFPYNSTGTEATNPPTPLAASTEVGSTWGLAYRRSSDDLFAAAYTKQLAGYKPSGSTGAIYVIHHANNGTSAVDSTPFVDLNALFGANTAGANPHDSTNNYVPDITAYDGVGKSALGGIALSDDESTLYVMNLANRSLYSIPIGAAPNNPVAPGAAAITHTPIPTASDCPASDMRPFAVTAYREQIYVGAVCSAGSTIVAETAPQGDATRLRAYVFSYQPGTGFANNPVFDTQLNYPRHCSDKSFQDPVGCVNGHSSLWRPWQPDSTTAYSVGNFGDYPQPMLTSVGFDNGNLILGLRDRYGDQTGHNISGVQDGIVAGDTLRACLNTEGDLSSGWVLENNAICGGTTIAAGQSNGKGPGNGQYYYQQYFNPYHDYVSVGGLLQVPGFPDVMSTTFDPGTNVFSGGTRTYSNTAGNETNNYEIYDQNTANTFGKANGLGGLVAFCQAAPIEIGDRVWLDTNGNGLQDAGEPAIAGVTVNLYAPGGTTPLQTTTTDVNGNYSFTISPYTSYVIKLDNPTDYTTGPLHGYQLTAENLDSSTQSNDSKATLPSPNQPIGTGNYPQIAVGSHNPGQNDYNQDTGFTNPPDLSITKTHVGPGPFQVGQSISYTLQVNNGATAGPVVGGQAIMVSDSVPGGVSGVNASGTGWTITQTPVGNTTAITASYNGSYPVASSAALSPITITGTLTGTAAPSMDNSASVSTPQDSNAANNNSTDTVTVNPLPPDLALTLTHQGSGCTHVGQAVTSTLTVSNMGSAGPVPAEQVITVVDTIPAGLSNVIPSGTGWTFTSTASTITGTYIGNTALAPGSSLPVITLVGTISNPPSLTLSNSATVTTANDSNSANDVATDSIVVCGPDLSIIKTHVGSGPFQVGQSISYTLQVSNGDTAGPVMGGQAITVSDTVPAGVSGVNATGTGWTIVQTPVGNTTAITASYNGSYPVASGVALAPITITGTLTSTAAPSMDNSATVSTPQDTNAANDSSTDTLAVNPLPPDLALTLTHQGSGCIHVGQSVTSTLTVSNMGSAGPVPAGQVITVTNSIPAGLSTVTPNGTGWTFTSTASTITGTYTGNTALAPGSSLPVITLVGTISNPPSLTLSNSATVTTANDSNTENDVATDSIVVCGPDLAITKMHTGSGPFQMGQNISYTLQVSNGATAGPVMGGQAITVSDTVPAGVSGVNVNGAGWTITQIPVGNTTAITASYNGSYPVSSGASLPPIVITGTLTGAAVPSMDNSASVSTPQDTNAANDSSTDTLAVDALPDLALTLTHQGSGCTHVGQAVTSTLTVSNMGSAGPVPAGQLITVVDTIPDGLSNVIPSGTGWTFTSTATTITGTYTTSTALAPGSSLPVITLVGAISNPSSLTLSNSATVTTANDSNSANDVATDSIVVCGPDLSIIKSHVGPGPFQVGQSISYTLQVNNGDTAGPVVGGQPIMVSDSVLAGVSGVNASGTGWTIVQIPAGNTTLINAFYNGNYPVPSGASLPVITVIGTLTRTAVPSLNNSATVSTPQDTNPDNNNNSDTIAVNPLPPDLALTLTHQGSGCSHVGQTVTSTLTVSDVGSAGPVPAGQLITVTDTIPAGLSNVTPSGTGWTFTSTATTITGTYTGNTPLEPGSSLPVITLVGTISNPSSLTLSNSATVTTVNDNNSENDAVTDSIVVCGPDLSIIKTHTGSGPFQVGQGISYSLQVSNGATAGPVMEGQAITVSDSVPAGVSGVNAIGTDWAIVQTPVGNTTEITATYSGNYPVDTGASLSPITITGTLTNAAVPSMDNIANVSTPQDTNPSNDHSTDTIAVNAQPDLSLALTHQGSECTHVGQTVTSTLTVSISGSAGPVPADQLITVIDTIPNGLSDVTPTGTGWTFNSTTTAITATYMSPTVLAPGSSLPVITLVGTISDPTSLSLSNSAVVTTANDSDTANDAATDTIVVCGPDLAISKTHLGTGAFQVGQDMIYTLAVTNDATAGPVVSGQFITVTDAVPTGLSNVIATGTDWNVSTTSSPTATNILAIYTGGYPIASGGSLPPITITGTLTGDAVPTLLNSASVSTPQDTNPANDNSTDTVTVNLPPDLAIVLTHQGGACSHVRDTVISTLTVSNSNAGGPVPAEQLISVTYTIPAGLSNVTASGTGWQFSSNGNKLTATYTGSAPLASGDSLPDITLRGTISNPMSLTLNNSVTVATLNDSNSTNDSASDSITVCGPDLSLTKTHQGSGVFLIGKNISYTLQVKNATTGGPVMAGVPVTVTDTIPPGLQNVKAHGNNWHISITHSKAATTVVATYAGSYPIASGASLAPVIVTGDLANDVGQSLINSGTVSTPQDISSSNDTSSSSVKVQHPFDVSISISRNGGHCMQVNHQVSYQLTVRSARSSAPIDALVPITILDALPDSLSHVNISGKAWKVSIEHVRGTTLVVAVYKGGSIAPGATLPALQITATVSKYTDRPQLNAALVDAPGDSNHRNDIASDVLYVCRYKPPTGGTSLPPTGSYTR